MGKGTHNKVLRLITDLQRENHRDIDDMTKKWLSQTPNPPRTPEFYSLTKFHKPTITARPIISGCDEPTERISSFIDTLLQPISKAQKSYLKDTTDFINFIEKTKVKKLAFLVSMDVPSLYTNIPQEEGIECAQHTTTFTKITLRFLQNTCGKCLDLSLKNILSNTMKDIRSY